jgi:UDP-2,3-diacylglucosamine pyrophosphatase LpxH
MQAMKTVRLTSTADSRFILFSDAHRGDGTGADDFAANSLIFNCALDYYHDAGFTLIELGDAEDLWENKRFPQIYITHTSVYDRLAKFHDRDPEKTRYIKIWGNHDDCWEKRDRSLQGIFPGIQTYEAAILDDHILMWHGHQADSLCRGMWERLSASFVRGIWPLLQQWGFRDPTRAANNPGMCNDIDKAYHTWATTGFPNASWFPDCRIDTIIAGHTHRPVYENLSLTERMLMKYGKGTNKIEQKFKSDNSYYNTGSCVHPRCITGIEITGSGKDMAITLIKWGYAAKDAGNMVYNLTITREILEQTNRSTCSGLDGR